MKKAVKWFVQACGVAIGLGVVFMGVYGLLVVTPIASEINRPLLTVLDVFLSIIGVFIVLLSSGLLRWLFSLWDD